MNSICYLSYDFSKTLLPVEAEICPEHNMNGEQIKAWVAALKESPKTFSTCSLFLLRELYLQGVKTMFFNTTMENGIETLYTSFDVDRIGNIEILDRELHQSDVYLNHEMKLASKNEKGK